MAETDRLIELRRAAGMSQRALAAALGIKPAYMCEIETRRDSVPDHLFTKLPPAIRDPLVRARIAELEKLL
jgi:transcriptional regulator with XRE-family HTH domain